MSKVGAAVESFVKMFFLTSIPDDKLPEIDINQRVILLKNDIPNLKFGPLQASSFLKSVREASYR